MYAGVWLNMGKGRKDDSILVGLRKQHRAFMCGYMNLVSLNVKLPSCALGVET